MTPDQPWRMIAAAAAGDPEARAAFVEAFQPTIRAALERDLKGHLGQPDVIDDLVQEVFVECFKQGGALQRADPTRDFKSFLLGIVANIRRRAWEVHTRRRLEQEGEPHELPDDSGVSVTLDRRYAKELFRAALEHVKQRAVSARGRSFNAHDLLIRRYRDDEAPRAIAASIRSDGGECTAKQVSDAAGKAKDEFRDALETELRARHPDCSAEEISRMGAELLTLIAKGRSGVDSPPVW
ncbi:MAG: sigma-70 family RNA polymerase sigma factor [Planctomycetes bacterium]|nr:sigma-70 family RNA polymerase sigma factor [Planctomycetota bacterium]MCB9869668.1 sigma-70 family RNA polymerase sigma factor [Planctomycetota bacterium]